MKEGPAHGRNRGEEGAVHNSGVEEGLAHGGSRRGGRASTGQDPRGGGAAHDNREEGGARQAVAAAGLAREDRVWEGREGGLGKKLETFS